MWVVGKLAIFDPKTGNHDLLVVRLVRLQVRLPVSLDQPPDHELLL